MNPSNALTPLVQPLIEFAQSSAFGLAATGVLIYLGLLWISIIIWVTRDSIHRSTSLLFQCFSILLNIAIPLLGVPLYLIIRPGKTILERYYEDLEHRLIMKDSVVLEEDVATEDDLPPAKSKRHKKS